MMRYESIMGSEHITKRLINLSTFNIFLMGSDPKREIVMKKKHTSAFILLFLMISVSCFAEERSSNEVPCYAETGEMSFELLSLSEGAEGGLNGILRCTNLKNEISSLSCSMILVNDIVFYNGTGFSGILKSLIQPKESFEVEFSITELFSIDVSDDYGENEGETAMVLKDPLGFLGVSEIKSISFLVNAVDPENEFFTFELPEPMPYRSFADLHEENDTVTAFEDEYISMRLERIGIIEDEIALSVILENKTNQKLTCYLDGAFANNEAYFEPKKVNMSTFDLYAGSKGQRCIGLTPFDGFISPFESGPEREQQSFLQSLCFSVFYEVPKTGKIEMSNVTISLPEPLEFDLYEDENSIPAAVDQEKKETAAKLFNVTCEKEKIIQPELFKTEIGLPEDAADQRLIIPLAFNEALTDEDYSSFESVYAIIQLRNTDPKWHEEEMEDCMLVRPVARVKLYPDGEGGLIGIYSGLVLTAGADHFILTLEEDGSGEDILTAQSGLRLNTAECFRMLGKDHSLFSGNLLLETEINYQEGKAVLADYSVIAERNEKEVDLTDWPISRFSEISSGSSGMYRFWRPDDYGFYDMLTSFRYNEEDLLYPVNNENVSLNFIPYTEVIGEYDEITVSYELNFTDGTTFRIHVD